MTPWIAAFLFVLIGIVITVGLRTLGRTVRSWRWPVTSGRLLAIDVTNNLASYEYVVAGRTLRGSCISILGYPPAAARRRLAHHRNGDAIPVWYDPEAPQDSALDRSTTLMAWIVAALGLALLITGTVWLVQLTWHAGS